MFVFLYWQLAPLVSASLGASLDLKKLLMYPIPHAKLFVVEVLLRITTCAEMVLFLTGVVVGLFRNPLFGGLRNSPTTTPVRNSTISAQVVMRSSTSTTKSLAWGMGYISSFLRSSEAPRLAE